MIEDTGKVSWNIAASQSQFVFELIKKSMLYYQAGNLSKWYWTLTCLREMINYSLKSTEREVLDNLEIDAQGSLKYWSKFQDSKDGHIETKLTTNELKQKNLFSIHVRDYQRKIMDFLNQLGYFPSKEDRSRINF